MAGPKLARSRRVGRWDSTRIYAIGDDEYPSVTSVIGMQDKPALVPWAAKMAAEYAVANREAIALLDDDDAIKLIKSNWRKARDKAADFGTDVHRYLEEGVVPDDPVARAFVASGERYLQDHVDDVYARELTVVNPDVGYAGTGDLFLRTVDGALAVADWKTGKGLYWDSAGMQLVALAHATHYIDEEGAMKPLKQQPTVGHAVRLSLDAYELRTVTIDSDEAAAAWDAFQGLISVWTMKTGRYGWSS